MLPRHGPCNLFFFLRPPGYRALFYVLKLLGYDLFTVRMYFGRSLGTLRSERILSLP